LRSLLYTQPDLKLSIDQFAHLLSKIDEHKPKSIVSSSQKRPKKDFLLAPHQKAQVLSEADRIKEAGDKQIA
jgi:hypothetical protein